MDIAFTLDDADTERFRNFTRRRVDGARSARKALWQPIAMILAFGGIITINLDGQSRLVELQLLLFSACLGIAGAMTVYSVSHRLSRSQQCELLPGPYTVRLTDGGLEIVGEAVAHLVRWSRVFAVEQDVTAIYVYESPTVGYVVPRRAFMHATAANSFFNVARVYAQRAQPKKEHVRRDELAGMPFYDEDTTLVLPSPPRSGRADGWTKVRESV